MKCFHDVSPSVMKNAFLLITNIPYNVRSRSELFCRNSKRVKYGTETLTKLLSLVPEAIKSSKLLNACKSKITR